MTDRSDLAGLVERFAQARVLVVGDVMLDRFVYGEVERISPEAPVPILLIERGEAMLGGAGNVARNLSSLGAQTHFIAVIGADEPGREVAELAAELPGVTCSILTDHGRATAIKTRYVAGSQQVLRADQESGPPIADRIENALARKLEAAVKKASAVVLSDYGKGALTKRVVGAAIAAAKRAGIPVLVDPKGDDYRRYRGARLVSPNRRELAEASRMATGGEDEIVAAARRIAKSCGIAGVLATRGADGMTLVDGGRKARHLAAEAREVFDVSGAGDTVIAVLAAAMASGAEPIDAARLANVAAGIVVAKAGTAVANADEIVNALHYQDLMAGADKLAGLGELRHRVSGWRKAKLKIGFTNGCFDLLHPGHVSLLAQARAACDRLIVGLNSDASVARLKGQGRPVQSEAARAAVLGSLASVDAVTIFADDTPLGLIEALRPDVLIKGADYSLSKIVGAKLVRSYGGKIVLAKLAPGHSTSATIRKLGK